MSLFGGNSDHIAHDFVFVVVVVVVLVRSSRSFRCHRCCCCFSEEQIGFPIITD